MSSDNYKDHLYALILAGGGGTRLWPRSRNKTPKQFLKMFGKKTLTEITAERVNTFMPWKKIFVVTTTPEYGKEIKQLLPKVPEQNIIVEPMRRDSAPAHALGALHILQKDKEAIVINAASDHFLSPVSRYKKASLAAAKAADKHDSLVAIGIRPTYPHTGMGHLKRGKKFDSLEGKTVYKLDKFVEKPRLSLAKKYTDSGEYFWNANQYVWRADTFLNAVRDYAPEIYKGMMTIKDAIGTKHEKEVLVREYEKLPKISVDYAVSEKAKNFLMVVADYNWSDIGDWKEVWSNLRKDNMGNVILDGEEEGGEVINIDTSDAMIYKNGRMIAVIDVDNVVIVDTKDALLVCSKSKAQNVKQIVEKLKELGKKQYL